MDTGKLPGKTDILIPGRYAVYRLCVVACLVMSCSAALASSPCTPPVCDPTTPEGVQKCAAMADWIVEGTLEELTEHQGRYCDTYGCSSMWTANGVTFATDGAKAIKGTARFRGWAAEENNRNSYGTASHCFGRFVRLTPAMIGQRVRLFGTDKPLGPNTGPGYFAYELVAQ